MKVQTGREVRLGLIALALSGLLWTVGIVLRGPADIADPGSCCRVEFSPALYVASTVIAVGAMLPLYGFFGLYRYLSYRHDNRIAFLALVINVAATALFFALTTFLAVSGPALREHQQPVALRPTRGRKRATLVAPLSRRKVPSKWPSVGCPSRVYFTIRLSSCPVPVAVSEHPGSSNVTDARGTVASPRISRPLAGASYGNSTNSRTANVADPLTAVPAYSFDTVR
jgi:hypothetical protein